MSEKKVVFVCSECGSDRIEEMNKVDVHYEVESWNEDGSPQEYGSTRVIYETAEVVSGPAIYWCRGCSRELQPFELERVVGE